MRLLAEREYRRKQQLIVSFASSLPVHSPMNSQAPILPLVELLNADPRFVTTSTCSGRISVFVSASVDLDELSSSSAGAATTSKGGGRWALSSHAPVALGAVSSAMATVTAREDAVLKHEPAILHVRCCDLQWVSSQLPVFLRRNQALARAEMTYDGARFFRQRGC